MLLQISGTILTFANTVRNNTSVSLWGSGFAFSGIGVILAFSNAFWTWNTTRMAKRASSQKINIDNIIPTLRKYVIELQFFDLIFNRHAISLSVWFRLMYVLSGSLQSLDLALSCIQLSIALHTSIILIKTILSTTSYFYIRYSKISVSLSLVGMLVSLLGAEQIVGTLASKVLSQQGYVPVMAAVGAANPQIQALDIFLVQANTNCLVAHFIPLVAYLWAQSKLPRAKAPIQGAVA